MNILIIGGGGREHALAWKVRHSSRAGRLFVAPGNGGIARMEGVEVLPVAADDVEALRQLALAQKIDLTIVGPEAPLAAGLVDAFQAAGLRVFGPSQAAARLETSKAFAKEFFRRHAIPAAHSEAFTAIGPALDALRGFETPPVVKASGLAAGKGVIVPATFAEAEAALRAMLEDREFGEAGATALLEERLAGPELSVLAFCDGRTARLMPGAQDHKRLLDGDQGPNTGGMGAFAPSPLLTDSLRTTLLETVFHPTLAGMAQEGMPYVGVLYAGLMLTADGPKVLEFNCRLGDPETQVLLPLLKDDLIDVVEACLHGDLAEKAIAWGENSAVTVVMASEGYPGAYASGRPITGLAEAESGECLVFHAGTRLAGDEVVTSGGRVLAVTGVGASLGQAARNAYAGVARIHFAGAQYRRDIAAAYRAFQPE